MCIKYLVVVLDTLFFKHSVWSHENHRKRWRQRTEQCKKMVLEEDDLDVVLNLGLDDAAWLGIAEGSATDLSSDIDNDSEGSLQPYNMSNNESKLERCKLPSQLKECATNLQKSNDPDALRALESTRDLCEKWGCRNISFSATRFASK